MPIIRWAGSNKLFKRGTSLRYFIKAIKALLVMQIFLALQACSFLPGKHWVHNRNTVNPDCVISDVIRAGSVDSYIRNSFSMDAVQRTDALASLNTEPAENEHVLVQWQRAVLLVNPNAGYRELRESERLIKILLADDELPRAHKNTLPFLLSLSYTLQKHKSEKVLLERQLESRVGQVEQMKGEVDVLQRKINALTDIEQRMKIPLNSIDTENAPR